MCDTGGWISYFIYELEYGEKYRDGSVVDGDGTNIDISDIDKLYDFLESEKNKKGEVDGVSV